eukprot:symbB.v1.2.015191.t1/scaffold1044.1/size142232/12
MRQLSTILLHSTPSEGADFLSYFSAEDLPRVRECLKRPGQGWPPLALNAKMIDSIGSEVHVELLHVHFSTVERKEGHYVGMREIQDIHSVVGPLQPVDNIREHSTGSGSPATIMFAASNLQVVDVDASIGELGQKFLGTPIVGLRLIDLDPRLGPKSLSGQVQCALNELLNGCASLQDTIPMKDLQLFGRKVVAMTVEQEADLICSLILSEPGSPLTYSNLKRLEATSPRRRSDSSSSRLSDLPLQSSRGALRTHHSYPDRYMQMVEKHQRTPTTLGVSLTTEHRKDTSGAKDHCTRQQSINLGSTGTVEQILTTAKTLVRRAGDVSDVVVLGLCLSNMIPLEGNGSLSKYFGKSAEGKGAKAEAAKEKAKPKANLLSASFARAAKREAPTTMNQEIDEGILAELPLNIQEEIRKEMGKEPRAKKLCADVVEIDA